MEYLVDFHLHSYYSDGTMSPSDLVKKFKEEGYDIISITDHDNTAGVCEAVKSGEELKIKVVPGIEISSVYRNPEPMYSKDFGIDEDFDLHILGYEIDVENGGLKKLIEKLSYLRNKRNQELIQLLNELGYEITEDELMKTSESNFVGKPDFVRVMRSKGHNVGYKWEVLDIIKREKVEAQEVINTIKEAGGVPVLAHPMKISGLKPKEDGFFQRLDDLVGKLKKIGLKGIECYHPSAKEEDSVQLINIAEKYHLHITKGSDFHGYED